MKQNLSFLTSILIYSFLLLITSNEAYPQSFNQAIINSELLATTSGTPSFGVRHTNIDSRIDEGSFSFVTTTWDGNLPSVGWDVVIGSNSYKGSRKLNGTIFGLIPNNPDIALADRYGAGEWALVVYQDVSSTSHDIMLEVYRWNTPLSNVYNHVGDLILGSNGANPKIESDNHGNYIIVWSDDTAPYNNLYAKAGSIGAAGPNFSLKTTFLSSSTSSYTEPDVSLAVPANRSSNLEVYFTFIETNASGNFVSCVSDLFSNYLSVPTPSVSSLLSYSSSGYVYSQPRISALDGYLLADDWAIVALATSSTTSEVHGFVYNHGGSAANFNQGIGYNNFTSSVACTIGGALGDLSLVQNFDPVISYTGDYITVAWTVDNSSGVFTGASSDYEVVAIHLYWDGTVNCDPDAYLVASNNPSDDQLAPAITGRYSCWNNTCSICTTACPVHISYYSEYSGYPNPDVCVNHNGWNSASFRIIPNFSNVYELKNNQQVQIFPNPFYDGFTLKIMAGTETINKAVLYDAMGMKIQEYNISLGIDQSEIFVPVDKSIASGLYHLEVSNSNKTIQANFRLMKTSE